MRGQKRCQCGITCPQTRHDALVLESSFFWRTVGAFCRVQRGSLRRFINERSDHQRGPDLITAVFVGSLGAARLLWYTVLSSGASVWPLGSEVKVWKTDLNRCHYHVPELCLFSWSGAKFFHQSFNQKGTFSYARQITIWLSLTTSHAEMYYKIMT